MSAGKHCAGCGAPLPGNALMGMCPRCVARITFGSPAPGDLTETVQSDRAETVAHPPTAPVLRGRIRYMGDYELLEEIAHGAMGVIFKARQLSLERTVAIKMILSGHFASQDEVIRFYAEAQAAANLNHPNIVAIYEIGKFERQHYYSMQLVEGKSLAQRLKDFGLPLPDGKGTLAKAAHERQVVIARLMVKVARAVHFAHQRGILHRDLKPANIMLDAKDEPLVTDFGLAKRVDSGSDWSRSGDILGTPLYMSPEQAAGKNKQLTTATDTYSLGAILYHLLAGRPPFTGETALAILRQIADQDPPKVASLNPRVDRDLETICLKCLEKTPDRRYRSAEELAEDLERWLRGEPISARASTRWEQAIKWSRRNPAIMGVLCTVILLGAIAFQGISWQRWETERVRRWESVQVKAIPVGRTCRQVHFTLSTLGRIRSKDGAKVARYFIHYADGQAIELPVIFSAAPPPAGAPPATNRIAIFQRANPQPDAWKKLIRSTWPNPRPEVVVESVDFEVLDGRAAPFLVTVVAE